MAVGSQGKQEVSFLKTCINGINTLSGIGILSVPYALSSGGWLSLIILILIAAAACFTGILIRRCMDKDPENIKSYIDIAAYAFGHKGRIIASLFTCLELYFVATCLLILEGDNLHKLFLQVLLLSFIICTITYLAMAILGYLIYGQNVQSQVTLNLPTEKVSAKVAIYTVLAGPIAKYALTVMPISTAIESRLPANYQDSKSISLIIRMALLLSTVVLAAVFPSFQSVASLSGAFLIVVVSFLLPCVCYLKMFQVYKNWGFELAGIVVITLMAVLVGILGTYSSIAQTVKNV
ncbi:amino acid transporter AVT1I-like [Pistacia vera]|uniref:amino acid transporter AVT1I-like n=1 Tax=Pistacia vera TaxID=55513 RepID=UPI001263A1CA|nr:amino acid transporter AVT1I-like [Pistacia vera]